MRVFQNSHMKLILPKYKILGFKFRSPNKGNKIKVNELHSFRKDIEIINRKFQDMKNGFKS